MREKILGKLHSAYTVIRTSTGDKDFHYQFREAAHMVPSIYSETLRVTGVTAGATFWIMPLLLPPELLRHS